MNENAIYSDAQQEQLGPSRVEYAYQKIKSNITKNIFPAGFQILEPDLASKLGVSRTPAREALIRLEADGLVELIPRRGMRVIPVSKKDLLDYSDVDTALLKLAVDILCRQKTSFDLSFLHRELEALRTQEDNFLWLDCYEQIQMEWVSLTRNQLLQKQLQDLLVKFKRAKLIVLNVFGDKFDLNSATTGLIVALERRQEHAAMAAIEAYQSAFKTRFVRAVEEQRLSEF